MKSLHLFLVQGHRKICEKAHSIAHPLPSLGFPCSLNLTLVIAEAFEMPFLSHPVVEGDDFIYFAKSLIKSEVE